MGNSLLFVKYTVLKDIELPTLLTTITIGTTMSFDWKMKYKIAPMHEIVYAKNKALEVLKYLTNIPENKYEIKSAAAR